MRLFLTAFLHVALVSANTYFIASRQWVGVAVCGFGISFLWSVNVKQISVSTATSRLVYSTGAMLGGLTGLLISVLITKTK